MPKTTRFKEIEFLRKWFNNFDEHFFEGYFKDKNVKITIEKSDKDNEDVEGWACAECNEIIINEECFKRLTPYGIRDVLLHEMVHLFVAYAHPLRRRVWGDGCRVFRKFERDFQKLREREFELVMISQ